MAIRNVMKRGKRRQNIGVVISASMDKTIVIHIERRVRHPVYEKEIRVLRKCYAHDAKNEAKKGDKVRIVETRPLSRLKRWRLLEIL